MRLARILLLLALLVAAPLHAAAERVRASFYGSKFAGRRTADGSIFDPEKMTAASRKYPLGTRLLVKCLRTGKSVIVLINDRGPWNDKFQLDLSEGAARAIGITKRLGWGWVEVTPKNE